MPKLNTDNEEVKNYLLGIAKYWIDEIGIDGFVNDIQAQLISYPLQITTSSFNLLGGHDTTRLFTLCKGNTKLLMVASLFQLMFYGIPCIYCGDDVGTDGEYVPYNRKCTEWRAEKQDRELLSFLIIL